MRDKSSCALLCTVSLMTTISLLWLANRENNLLPENQLTNQPTWDPVAKLSQDDPALIAYIRNKYLVAPAGPNVTLNFSSKIERSPILAEVNKILRNRSEGYFFECGAYDGEWLSNTIELEHYFGWKGVLVEADPKYQEKLLAKNRKAWIAPLCLSPSPHPVKLRMVRHRKLNAVSHIPELLPKYFFTHDFRTSFEVQCFPLYSIVLAALNRTVIDYLSLDVEGAEWKIIQTIPFDKLKIKVMSIEHNEDNSNMGTIQTYLESHGYVSRKKVFDDNHHDLIFAHRTEL